MNVEMIKINGGRIDPQGIYTGGPGPLTVKACRSFSRVDPSDGSQWLFPFGNKTTPDMIEPMNDYNRDRLNSLIEPFRQKDAASK